MNCTSPIQVYLERCEGGVWILDTKDCIWRDKVSAIAQGTNIVRREPGLRKTHASTADLTPQTGLIATHLHGLHP